MTQLICYTLGDPNFTIKPAARERGWMERTRERFAYRCLPLVIANACGWTVSAARGFDAWWDGGDATAGLHVMPHGSNRAAGDRSGLPVSHFGNGVLTFHIQAIFRTEPDLQLWAGGPVNHVKDAIQPLTGIIETDWLPFTFTMNWIFTRAGAVARFRPGEPICQVFPVNCGHLEAVEPETRPITSEPELHAEFKRWSESRNSFNAGLKDQGSEAQKAGWQRNYFQGRGLDGSRAHAHRTKLAVKPFTND